MSNSYLQKKFHTVGGSAPSRKDLVHTSVLSASTLSAETIVQAYQISPPQASTPVSFSLGFRQFFCRKKFQEVRIWIHHLRIVVSTFTNGCTFRNRIPLFPDCNYVCPPNYEKIFPTAIQNSRFILFHSAP